MRPKTIILAITLIIAGSLTGFGQEKNKEEKPADPNPKVKLDLTKEQIDGIQVAESAILVYSGLRGRPGLNQVRKTTVEIGKARLTNPDGTISNADYERRLMRGKSLGDEKVRLDQKFPNADYALVYNAGKVFGVFNNAVFAPKDDAERTFRNEIFHGLDALLRYKENGSKVELEKTEKIMGVEFYVVRVADKEGMETRFFTSKRSLRVMMLEYEENGVKYKRKFYDHNYAQGTLVPYRTVLWADGNEIEEKKISTITFGQVVDEGLFSGKAP